MACGSGVLSADGAVAAANGSDPDDLATPVLPAGGACLMGRLQRAARTVVAGHQRRHGGLPLRTTRAGIAARHLPLRDSHDRSPRYLPGPAGGRPVLSGVSVPNLSR